MDEIISGDDFRIEVEFQGEIYLACVNVSFHYEPNWGSDADGNRGLPKLFIDEVEICWAEDSEGRAVDVEIDSGLEEEIKLKAEAKVVDYAGY